MSIFLNGQTNMRDKNLPENLGLHQLGDTLTEQVK